MKLAPDPIKPAPDPTKPAPDPTKSAPDPMKPAPTSIPKWIKGPLTKWIKPGLMYPFFRLVNEVNLTLIKSIQLRPLVRSAFYP